MYKVPALQETCNLYVKEDVEEGESKYEKLDCPKP
jgi:hypothetical protein